MPHDDDRQQAESGRGADPDRPAPRPLDPGDQDDRVRAALGLTGDEPLPEPSGPLLVTYHRFLSGRLSFPLEGNYHAENGLHLRRAEPVELVALAPPEDADPDTGLAAVAERDGVREPVPLCDVEVRGNDYARQLLGDYAYWFTRAPGGPVAEITRQRIHIGPDVPPGTPRRRAAATVLKCGVYGAAAGAVVGALTAAVDGARLALVLGGVLFAAAGYLLGNRLGRLLRLLNQARYAPLLGGVYGALAGALVGVVTGPLLVAFPGTVLGGVFGAILGRALVLLGLRRPGTFFGGVLGAGAGGLALAWVREPEAALKGLLVGAAAGAALGVVLPLALLKSLRYADAVREE